MSVDRLAETMTGAIAFTVMPLSVTISTFLRTSDVLIPSVLSLIIKIEYFTLKP